MKAMGMAAIVTVALAFPGAGRAATDEDELTRLLGEFLAGAGRNDPAVHERFWADDLIYTGSSGRRIGKAEIVKDVRSAPPPGPNDPTTTYGAEDVRIQRYGTTALVAFRLVGTTTRRGASEVAHYLNTGTFVKRDDRWRAVGWQATRVPPDPDAARRDVAAAARALHRAIAAGDTAALVDALDESFLWTMPSGDRLSKARAVEALRSGMAPAAGADSLGVTVHGETAVARGVARRARGAAAPSVEHDTIVFVRAGGGWRAVAMHTSRP